MVSSVLMIAAVVAVILHPVLANPTDQHLTQATLRTIISRLEASLASKDVALQALASSQSKLASEFETCSSEQVKLLVGQQTTDAELTKLGQRYRHLEAEKLTTDRHSMLLKTENGQLMERISQLEHANEHLLAEKQSLQKTLSSLQDEYTATLQDSEAVHKKLLRSIKRSKLVKKRLTKRLLTEKKQKQELLKERESTARKVIQTIKDMYSDVLLNSETLDVSPPAAADLPQDAPDLPGATRVTEDNGTVDDTPDTSEKNQGKVHQEELHKETDQKYMIKELKNWDDTKNCVDHSDDDDDEAINGNGTAWNEEYENVEELNDNGTERNEEYENERREELQEEKDDYSELVDLMWPDRKDEGHENISDNDDEEKDNEIKLTEGYENNERTELQVHDNDNNDAFTDLKDSLHSFFDELDEGNEGSADDGNWDELNGEEEQEDEKRNRKRFRDEM